MGLFLEILSGELKGTRTPAREGLVIGRKQGQLTIRDSKLSGKHAQIELRNENELWLTDLGSQNAIKLGENKVREVKLEAGLEFTLGRTPFLVISTDDLANEDSSASAVSVTTTRTYWDTLRDLAARAEASIPAENHRIAAFSPPLRLKFIRGVQTGTEWTVGYGPRSVGPVSVDLRLEDPSLPEECFRLEPKGEDIVFKDESGGVAKLNGKSVKSEVLKNGDVIEIKNAQIRVEWGDAD
jgi:hypothetical protein